jgi:hypothetical protein
MRPTETPTLKKVTNNLQFDGARCFPHQNALLANLISVSGSCVHQWEQQVRAPTAIGITDQAAFNLNRCAVRSFPTPRDLNQGA